MIKCELCPLCGYPPLLLLHPEQAFCGNPECTAVTWNPSHTLDENLLQANVIRLPDWLK
ncbi:MAG: hypothetical protein ABWX96_13610 [Propionibacteriaceae bacterium]